TKLMSIIKVILAEDHVIVREGLKVLIGLEKDMEVIAEASDGHEAVELAAKLKPDVVVMDIAMPVLNGLEATRQIHRHSPEAKVIILSAHSDDAYVKQALAFGASGYLIKQMAANILARAIREVHRGTPCFSPSIFRRLVHHRNKARANGDPQPKPEASLLSPREMEVLQLVAEGHTNKDMAGLMGISIKTVEKHRHKVMEKLNIHDIAGLTRHAIENGIIESSLQSTTKH
ncbi:MAG: response regulator transcription factor, partial [Verrucomicrobiales bacterium]